jgi:hypothetical protein
MVHQDQGQLVQEVAAGGFPAPPSRYVLREEARPTKGGVAPPPEQLAFPTVDLQRLAEPGDVEEVAKLRSALESWGLLAVRNAQTLRDQMADCLASTLTRDHIVTTCVRLNHFR